MKLYKYLVKFRPPSEPRRRVSGHTSYKHATPNGVRKLEVCA